MNICQKKIKIELIEEIKKILLGSSVKKVARCICFLNQELKSVFRYKNVFQILPVPEEKLQLSVEEKWSIREWPCILEVEYDEIENMSITTNRKIAKINFVLRMLNMLTRYNFNYYQNSTVVWGWPIEEPSRYESQIFQRGFHYEDFQFVSDNFSDISIYPKMDLIDENIYYQWTFQDNKEVKLPTTLEKMVDKVFNLSQKDREKFDMASIYFQKGINVANESSSVAFICFVIAVEALLDFKKEQCKQCGQSKYSVRKRFYDFIDTYLPQSADSEYLKRMIYDMRSSLTHGSRAFKRDIDGLGLGSLKDGHERDLQMSTFFILRILFYNWLYYQRTET